MLGHKIINDTYIIYDIETNETAFCINLDCLESKVIISNKKTNEVYAGPLELLKLEEI